MTTVQKQVQAFLSSLSEIPLKCQGSGNRPDFLKVGAPS